MENWERIMPLTAKEKLGKDLILGPDCTLDLVDVLRGW